ncbi:MAG: hypothetical protein E4G94_00480 [ANME-2 cluster archaeon]|nr:MAG: hypothetical protein E4G94_00480 [ANME-2 cluster archaeon]
MRNGILAIGIIALIAVCTMGASAAVTDVTDVGNCLSTPVIWSDGLTLPLRGVYDAPDFSGDWWYWWGDTPSTLACEPDPNNMLLCDDGVAGTATGTAPGEPYELVYPQQDANNNWQAGSADWSASPVNVSRVDWGDNLESRDVPANIVVRTEVVLWQDLETPMDAFTMRHLEGSGTSELWGTNTVEYDSYIATVYAPARLAIQLLDEEARGKTNDELGLTWDPLLHEWIGDIVLDTFENTDYTAEINVGGKVIFGYNWMIGNTDGFYRLTFSLDEGNTYFTEGITELIPDAAADRGGVPVIDYDNNLAYIDVEVLGGMGNRPDGKPPSDKGKPE